MRKRKLKKSSLKFLKQHFGDNGPSKAEILNNLKQDYIALKAGTLKTRPLQDILNEL